MRTPPAKFLTDMESGKDTFFALKVVSATNTYYWVTNKSTFTLWDTTTADPGHIALTKDAGRIAKLVDGQEQPTVVESGIDVEEFGGGGGETSQFQFTVLNQDEYSDTLEAQDFIYRQVELRMGFVDTVSGTGWNDMLVIANYNIDNVEMYDWGVYIFNCVDSSLVRDKALPDKLITKQTHPRAPESSYGMVIPYLYGDFRTYNETLISGAGGLLPRHFGLFRLAPTVVTNFSSSTISGVPDHSVASHQIVGADSFYFASGELVGEISNSTAVLGVNTSTIAGVDLDDTLLIKWYLVPGSATDNTTATQSAGNPFDRAIDKDSTTKYTLNGGGSSANLYFKLSNQGAGQLVGVDAIGFPNIFMTVLYGNISTFAAFVRQTGARSTDLQGTTTYLDSNDVNSNSVRQVGLQGFQVGAVNTFNWSVIVDDYEYGCQITGSGMAEIRHVFITARSLVVKRYGSLNPNL